MPQPIAPDPKPVLRAESQWDLIWREFRKRRLAVISLAVILLIATSSILAPFIANDRPIYYSGYSRYGFSDSLLTIRSMMQTVAIERAKGDAADAARIDEAITIIQRQGDFMAAQVDDESRERVLNLIGGIVELAEQTGPDAAANLRERRTELRRQVDENQVTFRSRSHWPVIESLTWLDAGFITFIIAVWGLVPFRILTAYRPRWGAGFFRSRNLLAVLFGLPLIAMLLWYLLVPAGIDRSPYKRGVLAANESAADAPVVFEAVLWPPIPFGVDEDNLNSSYAPPIWAASEEELAAERRSPWDGPHVLGTDGIGRDVLTRMIWGGRVSLSVGIVAVSIYVVIGVIVGAVAGYFRGWSDMVISRIIEVVICFPTFFLILTIVAFVGPGIMNIMIVIGLTSWTGVARLVRGEFLRLVEQEFVLAGRALGFTPARIIFRHVLPNAMAPVLVAATFGVAGAILTESALSFLGFGITVPTPSWGGILSSGRDAIFRAPWLIYFPGLAIFITITAYNLVGEAFRDASDPRLRGS